MQEDKKSNKFNIFFFLKKHISSMSTSHHHHHLITTIILLIFFLLSLRSTHHHNIIIITGTTNIPSPLLLKYLAVVVNRVTCSVPVPGSTLYVHACHPCGALPAPGLAGCPVGRGE
jgi:hypothetical protein